MLTSVYSDSLTHHRTFFFRAQDIKTKKHHIPVVDRTPLEPPPVVIVVVGPPKVGKSTLIRCLIKNFTRQKLGVISGPVTIVSGTFGHHTLHELNGVHVHIIIFVAVNAPSCTLQLQSIHTEEHQHSFNRTIFYILK